MLSLSHIDLGDLYFHWNNDDIGPEIWSWAVSVSVVVLKLESVLILKHCVSTGGYRKHLYENPRTGLCHSHHSLALQYLPCSSLDTAAGELASLLGRDGSTHHHGSGTIGTNHMRLGDLALLVT